MARFDLDPRALLSSLADQASGADVEPTFVALLAPEARALLTRAATQLSLDREEWEGLGGDDASFASFTRSVFASPAGKRRWSVQPSYARVALSEGVPVDVPGTSDPLANLYTQLLVRPMNAIETLAVKVDEHLRDLNFPVVEDYLRLLRSVPVSLPQAVRDRAAALERAYATRTLWSWQALSTQGYLQRALTTELLRRLRRGQPWLYQLKAAGGMGKTMFVHHAIAHELSPNGVLCAHVDFDYLDKRLPLMDEPWRLLLVAAEQLNRQLKGRPLEGSLASWRRAAAASERTFAGSVTGTLAVNGAEVVRRVGETLWREVRGDRLVLFIDTIEIAVHRGDNFAPLLEMLTALREWVPGLRVVFAGRYDLRDAEVGPTFQALFQQKRRVWFGELTRFDDDETAALLGQLSVDAGRYTEVIHKSSGGLPWLIVRMSGYLKQHPGLPPEALEGFELHYAVERVLSRVDQRLQWLAVYASALRRVDKPLLEAVLAPRVIDGLQGNRPPVSAEGARLVTYVPASTTAPAPLLAPTPILLDTNQLWFDLRRYTEEKWLQSLGEAVQLSWDVAGALQSVLRLDAKEGDGDAALLRVLADAATHWEERTADEPERAGEALWCRWRVDPQAAFAWAEAQWDHASDAIADELCLRHRERVRLEMDARCPPEEATHWRWVDGTPQHLELRALLHRVQRILRDPAASTDDHKEAESLLAVAESMPAAEGLIRAGAIPGFSPASLQLLRAGIDTTRRAWRRAESALRNRTHWDDRSDGERLDHLYWLGLSRAALGESGVDELRDAADFAAGTPREHSVRESLIEALVQEQRLLEALRAHPPALLPVDRLRRVRLLAATGRVDAARAAALDEAPRRASGGAPMTEPLRRILFAEVSAVLYDNASQGLDPWPYSSEVSGRSGRPLPDDPATVRLWVSRAELNEALAATRGKSATPETTLAVARLALFRHQLPDTLATLELPEDVSGDALNLCARREAGGDTSPAAAELQERALSLTGPPRPRVRQLLDVLHVAPNPDVIAEALSGAILELGDRYWALRALADCEYLPTGLSLCTPLVDYVCQTSGPRGRSPETVASPWLWRAHVHRVFGERRASLDCLKQVEPGSMSQLRRLKYASYAAGAPVDAEPSRPWADYQTAEEQLMFLEWCDASPTGALLARAALGETMRWASVGLEARWALLLHRAAVNEGSAEAPSIAVRAAELLNKVGRNTEARRLRPDSRGRSSKDTTVRLDREQLNRALELRPLNRFDSTESTLATFEAMFRQRSIGWVTDRLGTILSGAQPPSEHTLQLAIDDTNLDMLPWEAATARRKPLAREHQVRFFRYPDRLELQGDDRVQLAAAVGGGGDSGSRQYQGWDPPLLESLAQRGLTTQRRWKSGAMWELMETLSFNGPHLILLDHAFEWMEGRVLAMPQGEAFDPEAGVEVRLLASLLGDMPHLVVLDAPPPRSPPEWLRQLMLRNLFARLLTQVLPPGGPSVIALGPVSLPQRSRVPSALARGLKAGWPVSRLAERLRRIGPRQLAASPKSLPAATALFTARPERRYVL